MSVFSVEKWRAIIDGLEWFRDFCRRSDAATIRRLVSIEQNARRYDWLRTNHDPGPHCVHTVTLDQQTEPVQSRLCFGDDLDKKIDDEMVTAGELTLAVRS